jgi:hypothetical protein
VRRAAAWSRWDTGKLRSRAARSPTRRRRCALGVMRGRMRVLDAACCEDYAMLCAGRRRRGRDVRRGGHVQGRHDHQHQGGGCALGMMRVRIWVLDAACCEDYAARCAARAAWGCGTRWSARAMWCLPRVVCRLWVWDRALCGTSHVGAHSAASHGVVLRCGRHAAWRIVVWPGLGPDAVVESQQEPKSVCEVRDSPLSVGSWISLGSVSLEALKGF